MKIELCPNNDGDPNKWQSVNTEKFLRDGQKQTFDPNSAAQNHKENIYFLSTSFMHFII